MSVTSRSAHGTKRSEISMSLEAVQDARSWLEALMRVHHRGPTDTWTAARDRVAAEIGLERTYARRLWNRWQEMKDVSGGAYKALLEAYEAECLKHENAALRYRELRMGKNDGCETHQEPPLAGAGMAAMESQSSQAGARAGV